MGVDRDYQEIPIIFDKGIVTNYEDSMLPEGSGSHIKNWQAEAGGLRVRRGWKKTPRTGLLGTTLHGRGIGFLPRQVINQAAPAIRNNAAIQAHPVTSLTATLSAPSIAGNFLAAQITLGVSAAGLIVPAGWALAVQTADGLNRIYYLENAPATTDVTFSWTTSQGAMLIVREITGIALTGSLDKTATASGTSTTMSTGTTATTTQASEIAFALVRGYERPTGDLAGMGQATNGFDQGNRGTWLVTGSELDCFYRGTKILSALEAVGTTLTVTPSMAWQGCVATFKAATSDIVSIDTSYYVADAESATNYKIWSINKDQLETGTWSQVDTITVSATGDPIAFAAAFDKLFYTGVQLTSVRQYDVNGAANVGGAPVGRCIAFHKSRLFIGGTSADPTKLSWSDVGSSAFTGGTSGSIYVNKGDGEPIEEILSTQNGLLIGKENSLWMLTGTSIGDFQLTRLLDGACAPGRSMSNTAYGLVVAGKEHVYLVRDGVEAISEPIETDYRMTGNWMSTSYKNGRCTVLDQGSGVSWVYDFKREIWQGTEEIGTAGEAPNFLSEHGPHELFTPASSDLNGLLAWRLSTEGDRTKDFDTLTETFEAHTGEMWLTGPQSKFTPRYFFLKLRQRLGNSGDAPLVVTPVFDGEEGEIITINPEVEAGTFWVRRSIGQQRRISSLQLKFKQELETTDEAVFDIEQGVVGLNVERIA